MCHDFNEFSLCYFPVNESLESHCMTSSSIRANSVSEFLGASFWALLLEVLSLNSKICSPILVSFPDLFSFKRDSSFSCLFTSCSFATSHVRFLWRVCYEMNANSENAVHFISTQKVSPNAAHCLKGTSTAFAFGKEIDLSWRHLWCCFHEMREKRVPVSPANDDCSCAASGMYFRWYWTCSPNSRREETVKQFPLPLTANVLYLFISSPQSQTSIELYYTPDSQSPWEE